MTTSGIKHATFRLVTQYLNQLCHHLPQQAMRMHHIVNCGLLGSAIFFSHYVTKATI
jgi:hypothetical protein